MSDSHRKILIIHNPRAGAKKKITLQDELNKYAQFKYDYVETEYANHASTITQKAVEEQYDLVVAAGGDGTVNEIASILSNTSVTLGIIPMGSGNGLARHLKIPLSISEAISFLEKAKTFKIDKGSINENNFFCAAGIGFDAEVSELFASSKTRGLKSYISLGFKKFWTYQAKEYTVLIGDEKITEKAFLISFANASQFGNNAYISPNSTINDGILDMCIIRPFPFYAGLSLFFKLFNKKITTSNYYKTISGNNFEVELKKPTVYHCDGEPYLTSENLKISIEKQALNVLSEL